MSASGTTIAPAPAFSANRVLGLLKSAVALSVLALLVFLLNLRANRDMAFIVAGAFAIQAGLCRRVRELLYTVAFALVVAAWSLAAFQHGSLQWEDWLSVAAGALGVASLATLSVTAFAGASDERPAATYALKWACLLPAFALVASLTMQVFLNVPVKTFDVYLYKFDGQLGFQASFWFGRLFETSPNLKAFEALIYDSLGIVPAIVFAGALRANRRGPFNPLTTFVIAGMVSFILYQICPGTAPSAAFHGAYPFNPTIASSLPLERIEVPGSWRNAMPSMHVTWAFLAFSGSLALQRWIRIFCGVFLALTCLATLGMGQHYLVDLIVACAFTVAISAACCVDLPIGDPARWQALAGGGLATLTWLMLLRLGWMSNAPSALAWFAVCATVSGAAILQTRLLRAAKNVGPD